MPDTLLLFLFNGSRNEWETWETSFVNTHSLTPMVQEGVVANVQANSKCKRPSDGRAEEDACKVAPTYPRKIQGAGSFSILFSSAKGVIRRACKLQQRFRKIVLRDVESLNYYVCPSWSVSGCKCRILDLVRNFRGWRRQCVLLLFTCRGYLPTPTP